MTADDVGYFLKTLRRFMSGHYKVFVGRASTDCGINFAVKSLNRMKTNNKWKKNCPKLKN